MPRRKKPAEVIEQLAEAQLTTAAELPPPDKELVEPAPDLTRPRPAPQNGKEYPSFDEKLAQMQAKARASRRLDGTERPFVDRVGPPTRPRTVAERGDMAPDSFTSRDLTIDKEGDTWQLRSRKELTGNEKDFVATNGLTPVDEDERVFNGTQREINRAGGDINAVAYVLGKAPDAGRGR